MATAERTERLHLPLLVVRLFDRVKQSIREVGDELGLSPAQLDVLRQLDDRGPTPMSRLADLLNCEASNLTGLVDKLEARGLVVRQLDPEDRRVRVVALTDEGTRTSHEAWFALRRRCPFADLSPERQAVLQELFSEALAE
jgi:DNA-binding MarR family transcriptional regulator